MRSTFYVRGIQEMPGTPMRPPVPLPLPFHKSTVVAHRCGEGQGSVSGKTDRSDFIYRQGRRQILGDGQRDRSSAVFVAVGTWRYRPGQVQSLSGRNSQPSMRGSGTVHENRNCGSQQSGSHGDERDQPSGHPACDSRVDHWQA
jgi:hypothetical protein